MISDVTQQVDNAIQKAKYKLICSKESKLIMKHTLATISYHAKSMTKYVHYFATVNFSTKMQLHLIRAMFRYSKRKYTS